MTAVKTFIAANYAPSTARKYNALARKAGVDLNGDIQQHKAAVASLSKRLAEAVTKLSDELDALLSKVNCEVLASKTHRVLGVSNEALSQMVIAAIKNGESFECISTSCHRNHSSHRMVILRGYAFKVAKNNDTFAHYYDYNGGLRRKHEVEVSGDVYNNRLDSAKGVLVLE